MKESVSYYLGIDIGTGSVRVMLIDENGKALGIASSEYPMHYPAPGHVEQDPEDWYRGAAEAVRRVIAESGIDSVAVAGIGICGTAHAPILLDAHKRILRPAILWSDQRSNREVQELKNEAEKEIRSLTRNDINCTWTLPQLLWVRKHEPDTFAKINHLLISKDYMIYRLTQHMITDITSAASSLMLNASERIWDERLIGIAKLRKNIFPEILDPLQVVGNLSDETSQVFGLSTNTRVAAGCLDSAAELVGLGTIDESVGTIRLGSAGAVTTLKKHGKYLRNCLTYPHPVSPYWYHQAGTSSCTASLAWGRNLFSRSGHSLSYSRIDALSSQAPPGCDGLLFHPFLLGERTPFWNSKLRGGFNGITPLHGKKHFFRAIEEGVAFSLRDCLADVEWKGVTEARICGGGAKSQFWVKIIADVLGFPVVRMEHYDASAYGAALIAVAAVTGEELREIIKTRVRKKNRINLDKKRHNFYMTVYERYRNLSEHMVDFYQIE